MSEKPTTTKPAAAPPPTPAALAVRQSMPVTTMQELVDLGQAFAISGMFGCKNDQQGQVLALTCHMRCMDPLEFCQTYHIIQGKPSKRADAMLATFADHGGKWKILKFDDDAAIADFSIGSHNLKKQAYTFEMAKASEICYQTVKGSDALVRDTDGNPVLKRNWRCHRRNMLWARLVSTILRMIDPRNVQGTYTPEEISDFDDDPIDVPARTVHRGQAASAPAKKPAKVEKKQAEVVDNVDCSICPLGRAKGQPWSEMTAIDLQAVLQTDINNPTFAVITEKHREIVSAELGKKIAEINASNTAASAAGQG